MALVMLFGCSKSEKLIVPEASADEQKAVLYADLKAGDVLVSVDGRQLTKADVERQITLDVALLKYKGILPAAQVHALKGRLARQVRDRFVTQAMLTGVVEREKVVADQQAEAQAWAEVAENYGQEGVSNRLGAILQRLSPEMRQQLEENVKVAARIYACIDHLAGEKVKVTEEEIDEIVKRGTEMKENSLKLLAGQREKALKLYERLQKGEDFSSVAAASDTADEDEGVGSWGDFSIGELEQLIPKLGPAVAKLGVGDHTAPIECDDAIYIVRLRAKEGVGEPSAVNLAPERRTLERIVILLPVMYEVGTREQIRAGVLAEKRNEYQKAVLLPELKRKVSITYPCGTVRFSSKTKEKVRSKK